MTTIIVQRPLDPEGTSVNNLVQNEPWTLPNRSIRAIAPSFGAFFTESLRVFDVTNQRLLHRTISYDCVEMYELPTERYGKEICAIILITDPTVSNNVTIDYQCLGGDYSTSATAIIQMMNALELDSRSVEYGSLINLPGGFVPTGHMHDAGDIYGFEYWVQALDRIADVLAYGDDVSHNRIIQYIDKKFEGTGNRSIPGYFLASF